MAAANYFKAVQEIYIAYYQRPADPAGLRYWAERVDAADGDTAAIINAFATSAEATSLYGDISKDGVGTVIDKIYQALFGRTPDEAGKAFYEAAFKDGTVSAGNIAMAILNAAREKDITAIENKVAVANSFTQLIAGREFNDPAFGTDGKLAFDYTGDDAAAAARQLLAKVTADTGTVLDREDILDQLEGGKTGGGHGGGAPAIKAFTVADAIAASNAETLPKTYKLVDTLAHLTAENAATLLEKAHSYSLSDPVGSLGTLTPEQIALVKGAANHQLYTYGEFFTLTELIGTSGDDTFYAPANSLKTYKLIDGAGGDDALNIVSTGNLRTFVPDSIDIRNVEIVTFQNQGNQRDVWGDINAAKFEGATAIWQQNLDVDVLNLKDGQTAGFDGTDGNILVSYVDGAESASIAIKDLASAVMSTNSFVISGTDLTTLSVSGSMAEDGLLPGEDATLRLHAQPDTENASVPKYVATENIDTLKLAIITDIKLDLTGNFSSLKTLDASESTGGIFLTLFANPGDMLQSGTIKLGDGEDHLQFWSESANHLGNIRPGADTTGDVEQNFEDLMLSIKGFDEEDDVLEIGFHFLQGIRHDIGDAQSEISDAASLYDAILLADEATRTATGSDSGTPQWTTFQYNGSTYIYQNNGDTAFDYPSITGNTAQADGLIELLGFTGALTEDNFVTYQPV